MSNETQLSEETLQDFVLGRLEPEERVRVESIAASDLEVAAHLALLRGINQARDKDPTLRQPTELAWARLSRAIDAETALQAQGKQRIRWASIHWRTAAASALIAVSVWQLTIAPTISNNINRSSESQYITATGVAGQSATTQVFLVRVGFVSTATEGQLRAALLDVGAKIVGGPNAIGFYELAFVSLSARDMGVDQLKQKGLVEVVEFEKSAVQ